MSDKQKTDWSKREIGALWRREGASQKYFSGHVVIDDFGTEKKVKVVVFTNKHKNKETQPDLRIYTAEERAQPEATAEEAVANEADAVAETSADDVL